MRDVFVSGGVKNDLMVGIRRKSRAFAPASPMSAISGTYFVWKKIFGKLALDLK
jgi:hypothetical protein